METSYLRKGPETHNGYTKMMTMITIDLRAWKQNLQTGMRSSICLWFVFTINLLRSEGKLKKGYCLATHSAIMTLLTSLKGKMFTSKYSLFL